ncbi:hypothetical protein [Vibrio phage vB_VpS_CA8]|nr:hypothetical protein [Vibrio phage vB_VpS_CA8]
MFDSAYTQLQENILKLLADKQNAEGLTVRKLCNQLKVATVPVEFALGQLMFEKKVKRSTYGRFVKVDVNA